MVACQGVPFPGQLANRKSRDDDQNSRLSGWSSLRLFVSNILNIFKAEIILTWLDLK